MAVTTAFQGELNVPYTVMDLGVALGSEEAGNNWLASIDGGAVIVGSIVDLGSTSDSHVPISAPSPFKDFLKVSNTTVSFSPDLGFIWAFGTMDSSQNPFTSNDPLTTRPSYARVGNAPNGALGLFLNNQAKDISCSMKRSEYATGSLVQQESLNNYYFSAFLDKNGGCYFFFNVRQVNATTGTLGYFEGGKFAFNRIGTLQPLRCYYLTDSPFQVKGTVTDAAGQPAQGRVVTAYDRASLAPVGSTVSKLDGTYQMSITVKSGSSIFVVCLDDDAPPNFEAQIVDRVIIP